MALVEISEGLDTSLVDDGEAVEVRHRLSGPFKVRGQDEAGFWIRVLEDNSFHLLFVFQDIVDPLKRELLGLDVWEDEAVIQIRALLDQVARTAEILLNVLLSGRVDQVQFNRIMLRRGIHTVLSINVIVKLLTS